MSSKIVNLQQFPRTDQILSDYSILPEQEEKKLIQYIKKLLKKQDAVLVAHYYTDERIQELAEETGGFISDSLEMARFGYQHSASTIVVAGVRFMGETAKILSPEKTVLMPTLEATCSLDESCPPDQFADFCQQHQDREIVVYANTSAAVKAQADWVVTSSIAVKVAQYLKEQNKKIAWAPDKYLGNYVQTVTGADMVMWQGACIVHEEFKADALSAMKKKYPEAAILVHPESPAGVIEQADVVGSTTQLIKAVTELPHSTFIVATDNGIFHKMRQKAPEKTFIEAPTAGAGATCRSCAHCPWMAMNQLQNLAYTLEKRTNEITIPESIQKQAIVPLMRMVEFGKQIQKAAVA